MNYNQVPLDNLLLMDVENIKSKLNYNLKLVENVCGHV